MGFCIVMVSFKAVMSSAVGGTATVCCCCSSETSSEWLFVLISVVSLNRARVREADN